MKNHTSAQRNETRDKIAPQSLDAEQNLIGACLVDREAIVTAMDTLESADDFYRDLHKKIYLAIVAIFERGDGVDVWSVSEELKQRGHYDEIGGSAYLLALIDGCPSAIDSRYARKIADKAIERRLLKAGEETASDVYFGDYNTDEKVERAGKRFFAIGHKSASGGYEHVSVTVRAALERLEQRKAKPGDVYGIPTPFKDLNTMTGGLHDGQLTVIASRPGNGKTSALLQIALYAATGGRMFACEPTKFKPLPVAFISLEMSKQLLIERLLSQIARVNGQAIQSGWTDENEWRDVRAAAMLLESASLYIDDEPAQSTSKMLARARKLAVEAQPRLIIVDYLQLAHGANKTENRTQEISQIGQGFCELARQFSCPVVAAAQLSRAVEQREDKKPVLSDLRESGSIEADAANVIGIFRNGYYTRDPLDTDAEFLLLKQRMGPTGTVKMRFFAEQARFVDATKD